MILPIGLNLVPCLFIIDRYYEVILGKGWGKLESDSVFRNKLKSESGFIFRNREVGSDVNYSGSIILIKRQV